MERIYDNCIICGRRNNSKQYNICNSCNSRIEHVEDIINLKNNFTGKFTKKNIIDLGYSKVYADALVRELLDEKLILKTDKQYEFNDDIFDDYLSRIEEYGNIEILLLEFASGKVSYTDIRQSEYYVKGEKGIEPYVQVYRIVSDSIFSEFLSQVSMGIEVSEIIEDTAISRDEIDAWYQNQLKLLKKGIKNYDFIKYNTILMDSYINLRQQSKTMEEIMEILCLSEDVMDFWLTAPVREFFYFREALGDIDMDLVVKAISEDKNFDEICESADIYSVELNRILELGREGDSRYADFYKIFEREYEFKRKNSFLYYLNENSLENSIKKAHLTKYDVDVWYSKGEKEFALGHFDRYADFYIEVIEPNFTFTV